MNLKVKVAGVEFKNPVITASGTFGFGREYGRLYDLSVLGGICTKGLTREPRAGNPTPRIAETNMGVLNSVGLMNPGVDVFVREDMPFLRRYNTAVIANVAGSTVEDYQYVTERVCDAGVDMVELNISCPNVKAGGMAFGIEPASVESITRDVRRVCTKPLIVKLSPNVSDIARNALAAQKGGADAVSLINTITGMAIDYRTRRPVLANVYGGLSGPCVKPVALKMIHSIYRAVEIPIIGMGGICSAGDIVEFLLAGANAVQIGTVNFTNPMAGAELPGQLEELLRELKIEDVNELIGALEY